MQVPTHSVPMSSFLSPEGQAYVTEHRRIEVVAERWADVLREVVADRSAAA